MDVRHFAQYRRFVHGADAPRGSREAHISNTRSKTETDRAQAEQRQGGTQNDFFADGVRLDPDRVAGGFFFDNILCLPVPNATAHYYYLPLNSGLFLNPDGSAQVALIEAGEIAFLQLTALWSPSEETLASLRTELAHLNQIDDPDLLKLSFAPVSIGSARLLVYDASGEARELARSATSGMPPYSAMFSVTVTPQDRPSVAASMNGQPGHLGVSYDATLHWPVRHQARLTGDLSGLTTRADLEAALADQRVVLEQADPGDADLSSAFLDAAAGMLATVSAIASGAQDTSLDIDLTIDADLSISAGTDIGEWFPSGDTPLVIPDPVAPPLPQPSTAPSSSAPAASVRLSLPEVPGADLSDIVALVIVSRGDDPQTRVHLSPSAPEATLDLGATGGAILLVTQYVTGTAVHEATVTASGDTLALEAADLGLVAVRIDPTPLEDVGADRARVTARYDPDGRDDRDRRSFHFRPPFAPVTWLLVARGAPLGQSLTYEWRATLASGAVERHPETIAACPEIVLSPNIQTED